MVVKILIYSGNGGRRIWKTSGVEELIFASGHSNFL